MAKKFLLGIVAAAAMVSCIKRNEVERVTPTYGSATITGQINVSTNLSNDTVHTGGSQVGSMPVVYENDQLAGMQVELTYDRKDLDPNYTGTSDMVSVFATVSNTGSYSFTVPTPVEGSIDVTLDFADDVYFTMSDSVSNTAGKMIFTTYRELLGVDFADLDVTVSDKEAAKVEDNLYE